jgi:hypothetical protein
VDLPQILHLNRQQTQSRAYFIPILRATQTFRVKIGGIPLNSVTSRRVGCAHQSVSRLHEAAAAEMHLIGERAFRYSSGGHSPPYSPRRSPSAAGERGRRSSNVAVTRLVHRWTAAEKIWCAVRHCGGGDLRRVARGRLWRSADHFLDSRRRAAQKWRD